MAAAKTRLDEVVDADDIAGVVAQWTGIPINQMLETESEKLLHMEDALHERIIGQEGAVTAIARRHPPRAQRPERPAPPDWLVHLPRLDRASARPNWRRRWLSSCSTTRTRWCAST